MVTYDNEFETKENKITSKDKTEPQHIQSIQKEKTFLCSTVDQDQKMTAYLSELTAIINSKKSFSFHEMINFIAH